jgi:hypothetical protein
MTEGETTIVKTPMPGWARFLVGLFIAGFIGAIVFIVIGSIGFAHWQREVRDPAKISQIAASAMNLKELPPGFHYTMGYSVPTVDMVTIDSDEKADTNFVILRIQNGRHLKQEDLEKALPIDPTNPGGFVEVKSRGEEVVGGNKMPYMIGTVSLGAAVQQFRGAMLTDNNAHLLRVTGTTGGDSYNMESTKKLLACIK